MVQKSDELRLDHQLCFQLYLAAKTVTQAYQPILEPLDITYPQYLALLVLWEQDSVTVKDLGVALHLDSGTLSPLLKRLQAKKLVTKERDADDERSVIIKLTAAGRALKQKAKCVPNEIAEKTKMGSADVQTLFKALKALNLKLADSDLEI